MVHYTLNLQLTSLCYREEYPVDVLGGRPLCMMQYYHMFCGLRIPRKHKDAYAKVDHTDEDQPTHIVVIHNNQVTRARTIIPGKSGMLSTRIRLAKYWTKLELF